MIDRFFNLNDWVLNSLLILLPAVLFVGWIRGAHWVLGPFSRMRPLPSGVRYRLIDFGCLMFQLSLNGLILRQMLGPQPNEMFDGIAVIVSLMFVVATIGVWWIAVCCLTFHDVATSWKRALFELLVVPVAIFYPLVLLAWPLFSGRFDAVAVLPTGAIAIAIIIGCAWLARWVARDGQVAA